MLFVLLVGSLLAWLVAQVPTYRRSTGERRQQLKWLYSEAVIFVVGVFVPPSRSPQPWATGCDNPRPSPPCPSRYSDALERRTRNSLLVIATVLWQSPRPSPAM